MINVTLPQGAADGQELTVYIRDNQAKANIVLADTDIGKSIKWPGHTATSLALPQNNRWSVLLIYNATRKSWDAMFMG